MAEASRPPPFEASAKFEGEGLCQASLPFLLLSLTPKEIKEVEFPQLQILGNSAEGDLYILMSSLD